MSRSPVTPDELKALGLPESPTGDWMFSDVSTDMVMALPTGTFFVSSNFRGSGFVLTRGSPPMPDRCCAFGDGNEMSAASVIEWLNGGL